MRTRLGWLGPAIVIVGLAVGGVGVWWMQRARSAPGDVIDLMPYDRDAVVVVRRERASERAFVEARSLADGVKWSAQVPRYGGRPNAPGVSLSPVAIGVRVVRQDGPQLWALNVKTAEKLGAISLGPYAAGKWTVGRSAVVSVGDGRRSYEVVDGERGATIVAVDLERGSMLWQRAVGAPVTALVPGPTLRLVLDGGAVVGLASATGAPVEAPPPLVALPAPPGAVALTPDVAYHPDDRSVRRGSERFALPAGALDPAPHHVADGVLWLALPGPRFATLDLKTFTIIATSDRKPVP